MNKWLLLLCLFLVTGAGCAAVSLLQQSTTHRAMNLNKSHISDYQRFKLFVQEKPMPAALFEFNLEKEYPNQLQFLDVRACIQSLHVNGVEVPNIPRCRAASQRLPISQHMQLGENRVELRLGNTRYNQLAVQVVAYHWQWIALLSTSVGMLLAMFAWGVWARRLRFAALCLGAFAMICMVWFMAQSSVWAFGHDVGSHLKYIYWIYNHGTLPRPHEGWLYYHPPLYYILAAQFKALAHVMGVDAISILRVSGLFIYIVFLWFGYGIIRKLTSPGRVQLLGVALFFLWPLGIMTASRADNLTLYYMLAAASFLMLLKWYQAPLQQRWLIGSLIAAGLGIATRTNAVICFAVIGLAMVYHLWRRRTYWQQYINRNMGLAVIFVIGMLFVNVGRNLEERIMNDVHVPLVVGNAEIMKRIAFTQVDNKPEHFLTFDYKNYFAHAHFKDTRTSQRHNFWVVFFKSAVTGEFRFKNIHAMEWLNILILPIAFLIVAPMILYRRADIDALFPVLALVFTSMAALMWNRWHVPVWPSGDFRYIVSMLPACIALLVYHLQHMRWLSWWGVRVLAVLLVLAFLASGLVLYMGEWV